MSLMWIHTSQYSHCNNVRARWKAILTLACDEMIRLKKLYYLSDNKIKVQKNTIHDILNS